MGIPIKDKADLKPTVLLLDPRDLPPNLSDSQLQSEMVQWPELTNATTVMNFSGFLKLSEKDPLLTVTESVSALKRKTAKVKAGDISELEAMLVAQATSLNSIFTEMARRAAMNMGEYISAADTYMRLALKAQSQARATVETIAEMKNPRQVSFVQQANIANGPLQVNNGPRARETKNEANELSGGAHELSQDTRASSIKGAANPQVETVGELHGASHRGRQGRKRTQQPQARGAI